MNHLLSVSLSPSPQYLPPVLLPVPTVAPWCVGSVNGLPPCPLNIPEAD